MEAFARLDFVEKTLAKGATKSSVLTKSGIQVDLRAVAPEEFPFALHHFTGSKEHNTKLRGRAKAMGLRMSEWGVFRGETRLEARTEEDVFALVGLPFIPPELREDLGEIEAADSHSLPTLVERSDIRGVLHVHTTASDGRATLREMARGAIAQGLGFLGIADHSPSAAYANGLDAARLRAQRREIEDVRREFPDLAILHGTESDILEDGRLDFDDDVLAELDFVVASVHSRFGLAREAMTERVLTALRHPAVAVLGHPTGRLLLERDPYAIDMERVLEEAGRLGVAVEINANPHRLDLDWRLHRTAISHGVTLSIGPDAHDVAGLEDTWIGVGIARKGWVGPRHLLNCRSPEEVLSFCRRRRENGPPARAERSRYGPDGERLT
jgi:DNA polymerase (family 10)